LISAAITAPNTLRTEESLRRPEPSRWFLPWRACFVEISRRRRTNGDPTRPRLPATPRPCARRGEIRRRDRSPRLALYPELHGIREPYDTQSDDPGSNNSPRSCEYREQLGRSWAEASSNCAHFNTLEPIAPSSGIPAAAHESLPFQPSAGGGPSPGPCFAPSRQSGILSCFFHGFSNFLFLSIASALDSRRRVACGRITSSM
jgi:hypothetical protein